MRKRSRRPHREIERPVTADPDVGQRVEEEDDVGVPLGVLLVHEQLATAGARAPVDAAHPVARLPVTDVGELDSVAARARELVADEDLGVERLEEGAQRLDARVHAQRLSPADSGLPRVEAEPVGCTYEDWAEHECAPALASHVELECARLARLERDGTRIAPFRAK